MSVIQNAKKMLKNTKKKVIDSAPAKLKHCFIITPIGGIGSDIFKKTDGLIKSVIRPVLNELGFEALPAYDINDAGSITKQIIQHILNDELVICNLTGLNPNVMYELAIRHSYGKKVVIMAEDKTVLPFDISDQRTIFYEDSLSGSETVKPFLKRMIKATLEEDVKSNPVIDSITERSALDKTSRESIETSNYLLQRFDRLERFMTDNVENRMFILSHQIRSRTAQILGIVSLLQNEDIDIKEAIKYLGQSAKELDSIIIEENKINYESLKRSAE